MRFKKAAGFLILNAYPGTVDSIDDLEFLTVEAFEDNRWCKGENGEFGRWDLPKGRCDDGETTMETAVRETEEEVGLLAGEDYICLKRFAFKNEDLTVYVGVIDPDSIDAPEILENPVTGEKEHSAIGWCTFNGFSHLGMPSLRPAVADLQRIIVEHYFNNRMEL